MEKIKIEDILAANPCKERRDIFLASLKKGAKLTTMTHILKSNGRSDALWVLGRVLRKSYKEEVKLFLAEVVASARKHADSAGHLGGEATAYATSALAYDSDNAIATAVFAAEAYAYEVKAAKKKEEAFQDSLLIKYFG